MSKIIHTRMEDTQPWPEDGENGYAYTERPAVPDDVAKHCRVSFYELPPGKSNYPYHYHLDQEEVFYIIRGAGTLKTPDGERLVRAGDLLFFPGGPAGAHKLTNTSAETLVYIDFDTISAFDVALYPDSNKIGVWGPEFNGVFHQEERCGYYDGEEN